MKKILIVLLALLAIIFLGSFAGLVDHSENGGGAVSSENGGGAESSEEIKVELSDDELIL